MDVVVTSTVATNIIYPLDDIGVAMYKRLKADADTLTKTRNAIKCKERQITMLTELWLYFEAYDLEDDAQAIYRQKLRVEVEVASLRRALQEQNAKVALACRIRSP